MVEVHKPVIIGIIGPFPLKQFLNSPWFCDSRIAGMSLVHYMGLIPCERGFRDNDRETPEDIGFDIFHVCMALPFPTALVRFMPWLHTSIVVLSPSFLSYVSLFWTFLSLIISPYLPSQSFVLSASSSPPESPSSAPQQAAVAHHPAILPPLPAVITRSCQSPLPGFVPIAVCVCVSVCAQNSKQSL